MNAIVQHISANRLKLWRETGARDMTAHEFEQAVAWCNVYRANPLTGQIYFFIFDKDKPARRRMVPVLSINLYRSIADRTGNYRPDDAPPRFTYYERLIGPDNPRGIVDCEVAVYKYSHGDWHRVTERLRWDERAPIVEEADGYDYVDTGEVWEDSGKPKKKKVPRGAITRKLDPSKPNWSRMPETMLAKCVEAAAIRKAWPEDTAGSYAEGETDAAEVIDLTATEIVDRVSASERLDKIGGPAIIVDWCDNRPLDRVPVGQFGDRVMAYLRENEDIRDVWADRNHLALREYWAHDKAGALDLKRELGK